MHYVPTLWIVWVVFAGLLLALLLYRGTITRYEDDELFLDSNSDSRHKDNDAILRRLNQLQPYLKVFTGVTSVLTATLIGLYAWDAMKVFGF